MADFSLGIDFDRLVKEGANDLGDAFGKVAGAAGNGLERIASLGRAGTSDTIGRIAGYGGRSGGGDTLARISQYGGYGGGGNLDFFSQLGGTDPFAAFNRTQANMAALTPPPTEAPVLVPTGAGGGATGAAPLGSAQWADKINQHAAKYADAPEMAEVVQALMELESGGNANAQGVVVTQGAYAGQRAQGLLQIMPGNYPGVNLLDPDTNIQKGMEMLYERFKRYGNWDSAVASYFGAVDANGRPTTAADDNGTTGIQYVAIINGHRQTIRQARPAAAAADQTGLIGRAETLLGTPYQLGGRRTHVNTPNLGIDCSEFTAWIFEGQGIDLPWNAAQQARATQPVQQGQLQVGDLVFFHSTYNSADGEYITHVGMYAGDGRMIHAGTGGVQYANLSDPYWTAHYAGAGRVKR